MGNESEVIAASSGPVTGADIVAGFRAAGVSAGDTILVHSSLRSLGFVVGAEQAVVEAITDAVGSTGTAVVPTQSGHLSDPAAWENPPVPADWIDDVRNALPAYDPHLTPTRGMGRIAELFRSAPDAIRSAHPNLSFAARGPNADAICGHHPLTPAFADDGPLGALYTSGAKVVLLGVDFASATALHLAEWRALRSVAPMSTIGAPIQRDGVRVWHTYDDFDYDADDFDQVGEAFEATGGVTRSVVGLATIRVCGVRELVDFATPWLAEHRALVPPT